MKETKRMIIAFAILIPFAISAFVWATNGVPKPTSDQIQSALKASVKAFTTETP